MKKLKESVNLEAMRRQMYRHKYPLGKHVIDQRFLSNGKECDRGDSFPFDYEPNRTQFGS